jgi:hypothetical protein
MVPVPFQLKAIGNIALVQTGTIFVEQVVVDDEAICYDECYAMLILISVKFMNMNASLM